MSKHTPMCFACGARYGETLLLNRYSDGTEKWCFPCVLYYANSSMLESPMWIVNLLRRFIRIEQKRIPWRYKLRNYVSAQAIIDKGSKGYHSPGWNLALWHTYRYKLMYEADKSVKLIYRDGVTAIKLGDKMVVSHSSIWESL